MTTHPTHSVSRSAAIALALILGATALLYALYWTPYGVDDSWITYRYAENIAAGNGFVYNLGERVLGTTTPLYTGLLALGGLAGLSVPHLSWFIGGLCTAASLLLLFLLVRRLHTEAAGVLAAGLLASTQLFHRVATYGMETPLYVALILGAFLAYVAGRELLSAALAAACLLMRLDGAMVGAALFLVHVITRRQFPLRPALVYVGLAAPWFLFSLGYFGSLVPNSMHAKRLHTGYQLIPWMPGWLLREPRAWLAAVGALALLASAKSRIRAAVPLVWAAMYAAAYTLARIHRYDWYQTPLLAVVAGFGAIGVLAAADRVTVRLAAGRTTRMVLTVALTGLLLLGSAYRTARRLGGDEGMLGVERPRYEAAVWMRDNLPPGVPIATGGIGLVGYYTGRTIHDAMGLVTPGSMRLEVPIANPRAVPFPRFLPAIIKDYNPEYVFDAFWLPDGADIPTFMQGKYEWVREWTGDDPRWPRFILYRRIDAGDREAGPT